jgi:hypothetical protein
MADRRWGRAMDKVRLAIHAPGVGFIQSLEITNRRKFKVLSS